MLLSKSREQVDDQTHRIPEFYRRLLNLFTNQKPFVPAQERCIKKIRAGP
jgi:hypothetical protein